MKPRRGRGGGGGGVGGANYPPHQQRRLIYAKCQVGAAELMGCFLLFGGVSSLVPPSASVSLRTCYLLAAQMLLV